MLGREAGRLEGELDRDPQHVEIGEVHDLAVEIGAPVAVDHAREEQPGDQEEVGHAERLGERDQHGPSSFRWPAAASTPSVECIITTMMMQKPLA